MKNKTTKKEKERVVRGWAIIHKYKDEIMEVAFIDAGDFKPTRSMFVDERGVQNWQGSRYKLIPVEIHYKLIK